MCNLNCCVHSGGLERGEQWELLLELYLNCSPVLHTSVVQVTRLWTAVLTCKGVLRWRAGKLYTAFADGRRGERKRRIHCCKLKCLLSLRIKCLFPNLGPVPRILLSLPSPGQEVFSLGACLAPGPRTASGKTLLIFGLGNAPATSPLHGNMLHWVAMSHTL